MKSPTLPLNWHGFAHRRGAVFVAFAMGSAALHCFLAGLWHSSHGACSQRCYPSPSLRSGPSQAGPILVGGPVAAAGARRVKKGFEIRDIAVDSGAITTNLRGSSPCASRLSSLLFFPRPLRAACRIRPRAGWLVQRLARLSPMRWTKTCWPAPPWAVWRVSPPAELKWACRPATPAIELAASGRFEPTRRTIRAARPGGPFAFRLGGADV